MYILPLESINTIFKQKNKIYYIPKSTDEIQTLENKKKRWFLICASFYLIVVNQ